MSLLHRREVMRKDSRVLLGLHELLTYGLKGVAAYAHHAEMLGKVDPQLDDMFEEVRGGGLMGGAGGGAGLMGGLSAQHVVSGSLWGGGEVGMQQLGL